MMMMLKKVEDSEDILDTHIDTVNRSKKKSVRVGVDRYAHSLSKLLYRGICIIRRFRKTPKLH
jgi:hypothetical protein